LFVVTDTEIALDEGSDVADSRPDEFIDTEPAGAFPVVIFAAHV
jgi:hypothetical protein